MHIRREIPYSLGAFFFEDIPLPLPLAVLRASAPVLDAQTCARVGARVSAAREKRGLTVDQICAALLLSRRQVCGLEQADTSGFHNDGFYAAALRKYVAFLGLPQELLEGLTLEPPAPDDALPQPQRRSVTTRVRQLIFGM